MILVLSSRVSRRVAVSWVTARYSSEDDVVRQRTAVVRGQGPVARNEQIAPVISRGGFFVPGFATCLRPTNSASRFGGVGVSPEETEMFKLLAVAGVLAATATFGEVFGDLRVGEQYVKEAALELKCGDEVVKAKTDSTGSYRIAAKADGKCTITVTHEGQSPSVDIVVFDKAMKYRLVLEKKGQTWTLRRV
jgi:hypothetical protein